MKKAPYFFHSPLKPEHRGELVHLIHNFEDCKVAIIGDVMLDEYIWGNVKRISPEAPVPVVESIRHTFVPGGAANVAANIAGLGATALLVGVLGSDSHADNLRESFVELGIPIDYLIEDNSRPTTTKTRIIAHNQQLIRIDTEYRTALPTNLEDILLKKVEDLTNQADVFVLSDYGKGILSVRISNAIIQQVKKLGKTIVVDPKGKDYTKYTGSTIITPNFQEAEQALSCVIEEEPALVRAGHRLLQMVMCEAVIITRGADGMSVFTKDIDHSHIPAFAKNVFDVTGAGDTAVGVLALATAAKIPLLDAAHLANLAAGIVVSKLGTATLTREELLKTVVVEDDSV